MRFENGIEIDLEKLGVAIITYNAVDRFSECVASIPSFVKHLVVVNDGTPYDVGVYPEHALVLQHPKNRGVAAAKNSAMRYLYGLGCEHIFVIEDDVILHNPEVFAAYIKASMVSGIKHFNYALQGYANARRDHEDRLVHPMPKYCVEYDDVLICFYARCSGPLMYMHRDCIDAVGYLDERFVNMHEHVDYTKRIIDAGLHPPYWYFADVGNAHHYDSDGSWFRRTTIDKTGDYDQRMAGADIYFKEKHDGHTPETIPLASYEDVLLYLLDKKPSCPF